MKLIRSKIAKEISSRKNGHIIYLKEDDQKQHCLRYKLIEECFEVVQELENTKINTFALTEEIADVLTVLETIQEHAGISDSDVQKIYDAKKKKKGDFSKFAFCVNKGKK